MKKLYQGQKVEILGLPGKKRTRVKLENGSSVLIENEELYDILKEDSVQVSESKIQEEGLKDTEVIEELESFEETVVDLPEIKEENIRFKNVRLIPKIRAHLEQIVENKVGPGPKGPFPSHLKKLG